MSDAKKVAIGVVSGVLGVAVLFALILMIVGKGDEPAPRPQPILAQQSKPVPPKPAPVQAQPVLAEQPVAPDSVRPVPALNVTESGPGRQGQQQGNQRLQNPENTPGTAEYIAKHIDEDLAKVHAENDSPRTATATEWDSKAEAAETTKPNEDEPPAKPKNQRLTIAILEQTGGPMKFGGMIPSYEVIAMVRNTSSVPLKLLTMTVIFRRADNTMIGTEARMADARTLEPGDTTTVKAMDNGENLAEIDHYDLKFTAGFPDEKNVDFTVEQTDRPPPRAKAPTSRRRP